MVETTDQYRNRINQLKTSIENEPRIVNMRSDIAEGISKTGNRQADVEVRQDTLEDDFVAVQQDANSASPSGAEVAVARGGLPTLDARLTKKEQEVTAQFAQTEDIITLKPSGLIDTNRIKEAIVKYGTVKLADGVFNIERILIPSNTKIIGSGRTKINLNQINGGLYSNGADNIGLFDFEINGNQINDPTNVNNGDTGIYITNCTNVKIGRLTTKNTKAWGIAIIGSDIVYVHDCETSGSGRQSGIAIVSTNNFIVTNNISHDNFYSGIIAEPTNKHGIVSDNICYGNQQGFLAHTSEDLLFANNKAYNNSQMGFYIQKGSNISLRNNQSYRNGNIDNAEHGYGLYAVDVVALSVDGNDIYDNNANGIHIPNTIAVSGTIVNRNKVVNNAKTNTQDVAAGVYISKAVGLVMDDNDVYGHKRNYNIGTVDTTIRSMRMKPLVDNDLSSGGIIPAMPLQKPLDFLEFELKPGSTTTSFLLPFSISVYGVELTYKVNSVTGGGYISFTINSNQYASVTPSVANAVSQKSVSPGNHLKKVFLSGEQLNFGFAHSYNASYTDFLKVKILYV